MESINWYKRKILDHSYKNGLAHISSCLNAVDPLWNIYSSKKPEGKVVLSCGHAYLGLRVILEDLALDVPKDFRTHPDRGGDVHCSTGSLGMGFPIALGIALAHPEEMVYCVTSDGEWAEGSMWESLRIMTDLPIPNIQLWIIVNGYSAYGRVSIFDLEDRIIPFAHKAKASVLFRRPEPIPYLEGVAGHYHKLDEQEYLALKEFYNEK
jgi:transketolase